LTCFCLFLRKEPKIGQFGIFFQAKIPKNSKLTEKEPNWNFQLFKNFLSFLKLDKNSKNGQKELNWN
jgi:hypothetical protein